MVTDTVPEWLAQKLNFEGRYAAIPECTKHALREWTLHAQTPGHFVEAVLRNDLHDAFDRADDDNLEALQLIVSWIHNELPQDAWLSPGRRRAAQGPDAEEDSLSFRDDDRQQLYLFKGYCHEEG